MRCTNLGLLLGEYADGYVDERGRRIVERHLSVCYRCRVDAMITHRLAQQLSRLPLLPIGVIERIPSFHRRIEHRMSSGFHLPGNPSLLRGLYVLLLAALLASLAVLIAYLR